MGEALRLIRIFNGYTTTQVAQKLELSQGYISEIENGKKQPTLDVLEKYAVLFHMKKSTIFLFAESIEEDRDKMTKMDQRVAYAGMKLLQIIEKVGKLGDI